jgi:hypothetical protein
MKKLILSLVAVFTLGFAVQAQDYDFTTGLRVGYGHHSAFAIELSGQAFVNDISRVELDLGFRFRNHFLDKKNDGIERYYPWGPIITGSYQWHWFLVGGFGVYGGPALQFSFPDWRGFSLAAGGQVGFDYQFDAPFQVSLDFRPIYNFFGGYRGFDPNVALGLRYAF